MLSGTALTCSVSASPGGPESGGVSVLCTVQPAPARRASAIAARRMYVKGMILEVPKVAELDRQLPRRLDGVAGAIHTVERHPRNGCDDVRAPAKLNERRLLFGHVPHQFEAELQRSTSRNRPRRRAVECKRHVDAGRTSTIGSHKLDVNLADGDLVVRCRRERR